MIKKLIMFIVCSTGVVAQQCVVNFEYTENSPNGVSYHFSKNNNSISTNYLALEEISNRKKKLVSSGLCNSFKNSAKKCSIKMFKTSSSPDGLAYAFYHKEQQLSANFLALDLVDERKKTFSRYGICKSFSVELHSFEIPALENPTISNNIRLNDNVRVSYVNNGQGENLNSDNKKKSIRK